jgi:hypothetical protein
MNPHKFTRMYNNFYLFLELVVSPTAVGEDRGETTAWSWGALREAVGSRVETATGSYGASREVVGSRGGTAAGSWVRRGRQWGPGARRWRDPMCVEGGNGEPGRDGGCWCWGETVTPRVFGEENPSLCTFAIVLGSVAIAYRCHRRR